jgi:hypothetical protein
MITFRRSHNTTSLGFYSGRGLLALFAATILLPGLLLCAFSVRGLLQERRLAGQQVREQLERTATETSRSLEFELHRWQQLLDEVHLDAASVPTLPAPLGAALLRREGAVVLAISARGTHVVPAGRLLYVPGAATLDPPSSVPTEIASAETLELLQEDYGKAIRAYESLLRAGPTRAGARCCCIVSCGLRARPAVSRKHCAASMNSKAFPKPASAKCPQTSRRALKRAPSSGSGCSRNSTLGIIAGRVFRPMGNGSRITSNFS